MVECPSCHKPVESGHNFCPACGERVRRAPEPNADPMLGRTLPGGFVVIDLVGVGGMGRVYRAEQTTLGRTVAVKVIHPHLVGEETAASRFITEARASSRLNHPNSISVIDFGKTPDGQLYMVMEFLRGRDLARVLYEEGPLSFRRIVGVLRQVLAALAAAHDLEIIHRDLKPENVFLEPVRGGGDFVKVLDFGLAKMKVESKATNPGIVCGTPEYMSPEQGRGDPVDARSDLYAVGVVMYQLLTGRLPFEADSPTAVVLRHLTEQPVEPREAAPDRKIPQALADVCMMALAKTPSHRFNNADELSEALADALAQIETSSRMRVAQAAAVRCGSCGAMNPGAQKFCGECGAPLAPSSRPPNRSEIPSASDSAPPSTGMVARQKLPLPFVGRDSDLAWVLDRRLDARGTMLGARVVGDAGVGKSRLLREAIAACREQGDVIVEAGPDPAWAEVGYHALRTLVRELADLPEDGGGPRLWQAAGPEARFGLTALFEQGGVGSSMGLSPEMTRFAAAEALRFAIGQAAERFQGRRVVLVVDDLHLVDRSSQAALADVVTEPPLVSGLVVVAYPPGHDPGWRASQETSRVLTGLPTDVVTRMLTGVPAPSSGVGGRGVAPLYVEQLVRFSSEHGDRPPSRLADLVALRVERLSADARRVLQAVCVFGDASTPSTIERMVPTDTDVDQGILGLERAGMLERGKGASLRASHPLLRDVVLATTPAQVRKELHAAAGELAEELALSVEVRALHELWAQRSFQALILLEQVSKRCTNRGDLSGAVVALRRGLEQARRELFRGELDDPERAVLLFSRKLGETLTALGALTDAEGILREALDLAGPSGSDRARVLGALAQVSLGRDRPDEAAKFADEAHSLAVASGAHELVYTLEDLRRQISA